ncbi:hypothetical protein Droror1_Dr00028019, partial [Drosera rotundifolia]
VVRTSHFAHTEAKEYRRRGPSTEDKIEEVEANVVIWRSMHWLLCLGLSANCTHIL